MSDRGTGTTTRQMTEAPLCGATAAPRTRRSWQRNGEPLCKIHGLRMLNPEVFTRFPFSSADSTNIGRNIGIDQTWRGNYMPPNKDMRAAVMRSRIEAHNAPNRWGFTVPEFQPADQGSLL